MNELLQQENNFQVGHELTSLPGVGFHPEVEIEVLRKDLLKGDEENEDRKEILKNWLEKAKKNLLGYWQEYIDQRLVLPIELEFAEIHGHRRVVPKNVKNSVWVDSVNEAERNGSIKDSVKRIEEFLLKAPINSAAVLVSPGGNDYPDTQSYIFWLDSGGQIDSMTIRTDPDISDNETFLFNSDVNFHPSTDSPLGSRVENVIRNPLFLESNNSFGFSPESIIETIIQTKKNPNAFKNKSFEQLFNDFRNRFDFLESTTSIKTVIDEFYSFCMETASGSDFIFNNEAFSKFGRKLGETVLKMSYVKRFLQGRGFTQTMIFHKLRDLRREDYESELRHLQTIPGCAGGGFGNFIDYGLGIREAIASADLGLSPCCQVKLVCGCCSKCNKVIVKMG